MSDLLRPMGRAVAQLDDPVLLGVLLRSLVLSALGFGLLAFAVAEAVRHVLPHGDTHSTLWASVAALLGGAGALLGAVWLFLPLAAVIAALFLESVARAVDRRFYPALPAPRGAPLLAQVWDGLALGARVLWLNVVAVLLALLLPGIGLPLGWAVAAWALGRGLFVAVAMRRMGRSAAQALYRRRRAAVLAQGAVLVLAGTVPLLNLLVPVLGTAAMVHVLHGRDRQGTA